MKVHVIQTGRVFLREALINAPHEGIRGFLHALFKPEMFAIPIHAYLVEHADGHILIDTGLHAGTKVPPLLRRFLNIETIEPDQEVGPQMRAHGLRPEDVRWVIPTHTHIDHAGGVKHFPHAEIHVHRVELEKGPFGRTVVDQRKRAWPDDLDLTVYDLDPEPYHSFPAHRRLARDITLVPTPGHSVGHVGILFDTDGPTLFFAGDHCLTQQSFADDYAAGRHVMAGFMAKSARETTRRMAEFFRDVPTVLVPAHDETAVARLANPQPIRL